MKKAGISLLVLVLLTSGSANLQAQKSEKKDEAFRQMTALIESGNYAFRIRSVNPTGGRTINPSSLYTMTAKEGAFKAHLPYFGRAYQASYAVDGGVVFDGEPENLEITTNERKRNVTVRFQINGDNDRYSAILSVSYSGYGNLTITSPRRQAISYYGPVSPPE
ncbi:MAG: DUF4251 domain-containing protein [Bacteroidota bacterium]